MRTRLPSAASAKYPRASSVPVSFAFFHSASPSRWFLCCATALAAVAGTAFTSAGCSGVPASGVAGTSELTALSTARSSSDLSSLSPLSPGAGDVGCGSACAWPAAVFREVLGDLHPRSIVVVLLLLTVAALLSRFVNSVVRRTLERHRQSGTLLPESVTRLQITRRILDAVIWVVAISIGLSQFPELRVLSAGLLASAGISGLIVGFAARSTLGNAVAGVTIAFAQPVRIGDEVELRGERGTVEDVTLLFTMIRLWDGKRMIVPNETLSTEVVKNLTLGSVSRMVRTDVLVPPKGDARATMEV